MKIGINATLWPFCTLRSGLRKCENQQNFIERLPVELFPDVVMSIDVY